MTNPRTSVLMPVHNAEKFVGAAINSALRSEDKDLEVIVVDDASTDKSLSVVKKIAQKNKRVRLFQHKKNLWRAGAINTAFAQAKGTYFVFLDADDMFYPGRMERQVGYHEAHSDVHMTFGNMQQLFPDGETRTYVAPTFTKNPLTIMKENAKKEIFVDEAYRLLAKKRFIPCGSVMIRRDVIDSGIKMDASLERVEDYDLWLQIIGKGYAVKNMSSKKNPTPLYIHRRHPNQVHLDKRKMELSKNRVIIKLVSGQYFN